ncbi:tetratricopeptide repeat protein [bacterium]|nr:tetratricopeptide repeat protein [bacterium]
MENIIEYTKSSFELKSQGFYKQAVESLYKALAIEPDNIEILAQLCELHILLKDDERAKFYIEKVLEKDSEHLQVLDLKLQLLIAENDLESALATIDQICRIDETALAKKLNILNKMEEYEQVVRYYDEVSDSAAYFEVAKAFYNLRDTKKAISYTKKANESDPENEEIMTYLAKLYFENKQTDEAEVLFQKLAKGRSSAQVLDYLGQLSLDERKYALATEFFQKANQLDNKNAKYAYNLASAYFMNGWVEEAGVYFHKAICLDPLNIEYHYSAAYMYYQ